MKIKINHLLNVWYPNCIIHSLLQSPFSYLLGDTIRCMQACIFYTRKSTACSLPEDCYSVLNSASSICKSRLMTYCSVLIFIIQWTKTYGGVGSKKICKLPGHEKKNENTVEHIQDISGQ